MTQAVRDAIADAETLRLFAREYYLHAVYDPTYCAGSIGQSAAEYMREGLRWEAVRAARSAAYAAFRAVPELRG